MTIEFGTKSETLERLAGRLTTAIVLPQARTDRTRPPRAEEEHEGP